ncbi:uncharacterized protein LOC112510520 [Cynara cardunculus var. scolymus]|uniref:DUF7733 domain-containing protein n=1 Tax=Cynara cardunculus var. scolymus TaxID=59895 RepID=A0A118K480_CYNCS|nr:uncharacterized protein LOC112510520 [Cynara cardunculus var. scolymus]KVI07140.1 hypothetical protein Ccrd_014503 [Cynara cardunculus var. scolymus]
MSGGVGPSDNIVLRQETKHKQSEQPPIKKSPLRRGILSFQQLNALALVVVLSASGMVAMEDLIFVVLSFFYMFFLSKVAFPTLSPSHNKPVFDDDNHLLSLYCFLGAVVGLFLPVAYIFEGILEGDKEGIKAATPHVFLLGSQLFLEGVAFSDRFSLPMRALVPVVYNSTRIFTVMEWVKSEISKVEGSGSFRGSHRRLIMGRVLAIANMVYWSFNLLGFLLPVYLPRAFKRYYSDPKMSKIN